MRTEHLEYLLDLQNTLSLNKTAENLSKLQERHTEDEESQNSKLDKYIEESRKDEIITNI